MAPNPSRRRALLTCEKVGRAVRVLRERRGLSQAKLSALAGVDRPALGSIERGKQWGILSTYDKLLLAMNASWIEFATVLDMLAASKQS